RAGPGVGCRIGHGVAVAVPVILLVAIGAAEEEIDIGACAYRCIQISVPAFIGAELAEHFGGPLLVRPQNVLCILRAEIDHAADGAGAINVRNGAAPDIDTGNGVRLDVELAVCGVTGALEVLTRAVDQDSDA